MIDADRKRNENYIRSLACIVTGRYGADAAHFPRRRSHGGDSTILNLVPLSRRWHRLVDDYHEPECSIVADLALHFHKRMIQSEKFGAERLGEKYWED